MIAPLLAFGFPIAGFPIAGFFVAVTAGGLLILAALAAAGIWVPPAGWWRTLAIAGAALLACLMALFFGPTKLIPLALALGTLYLALTHPTAIATGGRW